MSLEAYLQVGDAGASIFNLHDGVFCFVLGDGYSHGNWRVPGGVNFNIHERGVYSKLQTAGPAGTVPIQIGVFILGSAITTLNNSCGLIATQFERAAQARGPQVVGTSVVFVFRRDSTDAYSYWDVQGGIIQTYDHGLAQPQSGFRPAFIRLDVLPNGRLAPITSDTISGTLTAWTPASQRYRASVSAQAEAPLTLQLTGAESGGKAIQQVRIAARHHPDLGSSDFTGIYAGVTSPTTDLNGAVAVGATSIVVDSAAGLAANQVLIIDTGSVQELVTVGAGYVSGTTIPLAAGLLYAHADEAIVIGNVAGQMFPCTPGAKVADATAANGGGNVAQVTASASWQMLMGCLSASGAMQNGKLAPLVRIKDASATIGATTDASLAPPVVTPNAGHLSSGLYTVFYVPKNGTNYGAPTGQVSANVQNLLPGGNTAPSMNILVYEDFEGQSWQYITTTQAPTSITIDGTAKHTGSFGLHLGATNAIVDITSPLIPASKILSFRFDIQLPSIAGLTNSQIIAALEIGTGFTTMLGLTTASPTLVWSANAAVGGTNTATFAAATWYTLEFLCDYSGNEASYRIFQNGVEVAAAIAAISTTYPTILRFNCGGAANMWIDNLSIADQYQGLTSIAGGGSMLVGITHASGEGSGFGDLFWQGPGSSGWYKVSSVGNVASYTLSQWPPPSSTLQAYPAITPVAPVLVRAGAAVLGRSTRSIVWGDPVPCFMSNGAWETVLLPPLDLPPVVRAQGQSQDAWMFFVQVQAQNGGTPLVSGDAVAFLPQKEDMVRAFVPNGTAPPAGAVWEIDTRYDGRARCVIKDTAGNILMEPICIGSLMLGPGPTALVPIVDVADANNFPVSDAINGLFKTQLTRITPTAQQGLV